MRSTLPSRISSTDPLAGQKPYRRLFLDAMVLEESHGLKRLFHAAKKYARNPVIVKDHEWEGSGPYIYGTVMLDDGLLKMWYQGFGPGSADVLYAESTDGVYWTKPPLGIVEYHGSKWNNIVAPNGVCHIPSVIRLPKAISSGNQWAMYGYRYTKDQAGQQFIQGGPSVIYSSDGLHWDLNPTPEQQALFKSSDVTNFFYDPYTSRITATLKTTNRRHRAVGLAVSEDGLKWHKPCETSVFGADDLDPDATQVYGMPVCPYQGMYIGLPWIYHARWIKYGRYSKPEVMYEAQQGSDCTVDVQFAWSHDLHNWTRTPQRQPFISLGTKGTWDSGMIYTARAPVLMGDRLFFYYGGFDTLHDDSRDMKGSIGLATLRLDGFCSMNAASTAGWLISRREVFNTPTVAINARCMRGGSVTAELLDRSNMPIVGFTRHECVPFTGDAVCHELRWKAGKFPQSLIDRDKKIRFYLQNAELFSYLPTNINQQIDDSNPDH